MNYTVYASAGPKRRLVNSIMPSLLEQLNITKHRGQICVLMSNTVPGSGLASKTGHGLYTVAINTSQSIRDVGIALAHEMVHVKQIARGQLKTVRGTHHWMGRKINNKIHYLNRPYEVEAFARQEMLFRRAIEK